jgi:hypothetical protein
MKRHLAIKNAPIVVLVEENCESKHIDDRPLPCGEGDRGRGN